MNPLRGILLKIASVALFMAMASFIKQAAAEGVPPGERIFFRSVFAIPVILIWLWWRHDLREGLKTKNPMGHLWRGLVGGTAMVLGFTALGLLPLPEVTAIGYAAPLLTVIFAAMFLGEQVRIFRLTAVLVGLCGVVIILSPRLSVLSFDDASKLETVGAFAMLTAAVFMALAQVFVRKLVQTEATPAIVFYFSLVTTGIGLLSLPFGWVWPGGWTLLMLIGAGVVGGLGQILLTESYRHAETSVIAPFEYASMLLAIGVGFFVFDEVPSHTVLAGASLIVAAGLYIIWREHRLGLERAAQRRVMTPQG
ncbi:MAG: DMT family transporter [Pseudomonadota bacterium]